jgi:hypothetical protein
MSSRIITWHFTETDFAPLSRVLESLKAARRLPETRFAAVKLASHRQKSVYGGMTASVSSSSSKPGDSG